MRPQFSSQIYPDLPEPRWHASHALAQVRDVWFCLKFASGSMYLVLTCNSLIALVTRVLNASIELQHHASKAARGFGVCGTVENSSAMCGSARNRNVFLLLTS